MAFNRIEMVLGQLLNLSYVVNEEADTIISFVEDQGLHQTTPSTREAWATRKDRISNTWQKKHGGSANQRTEAYNT